MADWDVHKPLGVCSGTKATIAYGDDYIGALIETENGLERRDYSLTFWKENSPAVFCFWRSRLPHPEEKKKLFVNDEMLMAFFDRLTGDADLQRINFRFVLMLILMRKRKLKYDGTLDQDGQELWRLKVTGEKRTVEVVNPHLGEEEIETLSEQIGEVLHADL